MSKGVCYPLRLQGNASGLHDRSQGLIAVFLREVVRQLCFPERQGALAPRSVAVVAGRTADDCDSSLQDHVAFAFDDKRLLDLRQALLRALRLHVPRLVSRRRGIGQLIAVHDGQN